MPISRMQQPRQMYGLGSLVKSVTKGVKSAVSGAVDAVKDVAKSDIGKLALMYGATAGLGSLGAGGGLGSLFRGSTYLPSNVMANLGTSLGAAKTGLFGKTIMGGNIAKGAGYTTPGLLGTLGLTKGGGSMGLTGLGKVAGIAGLSGLAGFMSQQGMSEQEIEEVSRNPEALKVYLRQYYSQLNPKASPMQIDRFVEANTAEYRADGGRIGYQEGSNPLYEKVQQYLSQPIPGTTATSTPAPAATSAGTTQTLNPYGLTSEQLTKLTTMDPMYSTLPSKEQIYQTYGYEYKPSDLYNYQVGQETPEGYRKVDMDGDFYFEKKYSMPLDPVIFGIKNPYTDPTKQGEAYAKYLYDIGMGPDPSTMNFNNGGRAQYGNGTEEMGMIDPKKFKQAQTMIKMGADVSTISSITGLSEAQINQIQKTQGKADGGRIGYAYGNRPEDNAIQASGIEGLPLNQNPAGIKELDLRETGGFIPPVGVKEKADDIPAMLSNNEFVFTADAVRGMGNGDVNKGAQRMYDMMKKLENGGRV